MKKRFDWIFILCIGVTIAYLLLMFAMIKIFADYKVINPTQKYYYNVRLYTNPHYKAKVVQQRHYWKLAKYNQIGIGMWIKKQKQK